MTTSMWVWLVYSAIVSSFLNLLVRDFDYKRKPICNSIIAFAVAMMCMMFYIGKPNGSADTSMIILGAFTGIVCGTSLCICSEFGQLNWLAKWIMESERFGVTVTIVLFAMPLVATIFLLENYHQTFSGIYGFDPSSVSLWERVVKVSKFLLGILGIFPGLLFSIVLTGFVTGWAEESKKKMHGNIMVQVQ